MPALQLVVRMVAVHIVRATPRHDWREGGRPSLDPSASLCLSQSQLQPKGAASTSLPVTLSGLMEMHDALNAMEGLSEFLECSVSWTRRSRGECLAHVD